MHEGKYVFSQIISFLSHKQFDACVEKYDGDKGVRNYTCWQQFLCMSFGQLTYRNSLRDIVICLNIRKVSLYHFGIRGTVSRSTMADANEKRDFRIYEAIAHVLIREAKALYIDENDFSLDIENMAYALDSSTIDLCLSAFPWAIFREKKGAVKMHTVLDLRGNIPTFVSITHGKVHDVKALDDIEFEAGAFYVMDKAYTDTNRLHGILRVSAFFLLPAKDNLQFKRLYSNPVGKEMKEAGIRCDQVIRFKGKKQARQYPDKLRRIKYYDQENDKRFVFLTNNFTVPAKTIADLYRYRWQIELFFKWIKQHLKIKVFWGQSENAVKTQIWIAVCTYLLVAIVKKKLKLEQSLYEILQILSVAPFEKVPLKSLFQGVGSRIPDGVSPEQATLLEI